MCTALAGETQSLSADERRVVATTVIDAVRGRVPVFVGVGAGGVEESVAYARFAAGEGADCICVPASVGEGGSAGSVVDDLARVAVAVELPVMLQDAPAYLGYHLEADAVVQVARHAQNVRHVKVEGGSRVLERTRAGLGDAFSVWGGDGGLHLLDCQRSGAVGNMPGPEVTDLLVDAYRAEVAGDREGAERLARRVLSFLCFAMQSLPHYVAAAKALLVRRGVLGCAATRQSGATLTPTSVALLERHAAAAGL
jgi:2-keto-3-deoxy-L-arabinonate dehydratase